MIMVLLIFLIRFPPEPNGYRSHETETGFNSLFSYIEKIMGQPVKFRTNWTGSINQKMRIRAPLGGVVRIGQHIDRQKGGCRNA